MINLRRGPVARAIKAVFYGPEGVGKSTLSSKAPFAVFIDVEDGTSQLDVSRTQKPLTWEELLQLLKEIASSKGVCRTVVIDTADKAEALCIEYICRKYKVDGLESFGYGKGYTYASEEYGRMLTILDQIVEAGINVIVTAHAKMRKFELPEEQGAFDRWEMKLSKGVAPLVKEWADLLLFCSYKTLVIQSENKTNKAHGAKRVMYTTHSAVWDAKNRFGLPDEMDMDFSGIAKFFAAEPPEEAEPVLEELKVTEKTLNELKAAMKEDGITDDEIRGFVETKKHYSKETPISDYTEKFVSGWLMKYREQIKALIEKDREEKSS